MPKHVRSEETPGANFFRNLVEGMPHMVWTARADGSLDYVNDYLVSYAGAEPSELLGWGWERFVHPQQLDTTVVRWKNALATGQAYVTENRYRRHDGEYRWHIEAVMPWREDGEITRWFGTVTDVHERKYAWTQLEERRQKLEGILAGPNTVALMQKLSSREHQVLDLVLEGHTSAEIAAKLGVAPGSIDTYRARIMAKLGVDNMPALVKFALLYRMTSRGQ